MFFFLSGGELYKWDDFFSEHFNIGVKFVNVDEIVGIETVDAVTVGTALSREILSGIDINLLAHATDTDVPIIPLDIKKTGIVEGIIGGLILLSMFFVYQPKISKINKELKKNVATLGQYSAISFADINKTKTEIEGKISLIRKLNKETYQLGKKLSKVLDVMQEDTWLDLIRFENHMDRKKKIQGAVVHFIGKVYKKDKVQDMLLINKIKSAISKDSVLMHKFKYCMIDKMQTVNTKKGTMTSFDIVLKNKLKK